MVRITEFELPEVAEQNVQPLGWSLAILGRDDEVRALDIHPHFDMPPLPVGWPNSELSVRPWSEAFQEIAEQHRLVMIMEDHFVSKHREMIGATLTCFHDAGFTHYAVEAIGESRQALSRRGFPTFRTGFYTTDPAFGNAIRRALDLGFDVTGYDFRPFSHDLREDYATKILEKILDDAENKLLVHAGHAHVFKEETELGQRWLAARLWERTGIEPFTIWQWSSMHDSHEYRAIANAIRSRGQFTEPVVLLPPPVTDDGRVPAVDAIVVHPDDLSAAPSKRTPLFSADHQPVMGKWLTKRWPVVVAAYKKNEPDEAVPLDQVLLRNGESDFRLWVPNSSEYRVAILGETGPVEVSIQVDDNATSVRQCK